MNEIVIKDGPYSKGVGLSETGTIIISAGCSSVWIDPSEALQLADAIYKLLGEPTREQCFEAGREGIYGYGRYRELTDYINEFKKDKQ